MKNYGRSKWDQGHQKSSSVNEILVKLVIELHIYAIELVQLCCNKNVWIQAGRKPHIDMICLPYGYSVYNDISMVLGYYKIISHDMFYKYKLHL